MMRTAAGTSILVVGAAMALLAVKACLRIAPAWTIRMASRLSSGAAADGHHRVARLTRAVYGIGRVPFLSSSCLSRSITVLVLARAAGVRPTLVIGAQRSGRELHAHAWLECGGVVVPHEETRAYARLWAAS